ncbi:MAG: sigma-70 family RNA polymerase sigma factor [Candidatus Poribacteria bacterium]|nr:sigma-70 family RNA polymerase sigma factor [Candidatus Poribacteria bacterium]
MNTKPDFLHFHQLYSELDHFISSTPILSLEEEQACAFRGTAEARERLVLSHLRLVKSIAFGFTGCGVDVKDIFNQGVIGLLKAVDRYLPSCGRLATFARHYILGEILCYLNKARTLFYFPTSLRRSVNRFLSVCKKLGEGATDAEIAAEMECAVDQVSCFRECSEHHFESLDALLTDSDDVSDEALTLSETLGSIDPGFAEVDAKLTVAQLLSQLSSIAQEVIRLRYGLEGPALSLRAVAARFGKSHEWVSKIEKAAMMKLRKHANYGEL